MKYQVIKCLKVLGIKSIDELIEKDLNDIHNQKYKNILDSSLSKNEKTEQLIELNNAKELIEKFDIEEIKNLISKEKSEKVQNSYKKLNFLTNKISSAYPANYLSSSEEKSKTQQNTSNFINFIKNALPPKYQSSSPEQIRKNQKEILKVLLICLPFFLIIFVPIANRISKNNAAKRECVGYNRGEIPNKSSWSDIFAQDIYDRTYDFCLRINGYKGKWKY